jgi:hypothetical protein
MQTNHPRKCDCMCHRPGMEVKHMVACCCKHGYRRFECEKCKEERRTAALAAQDSVWEDDGGSDG